MILSGFHFCEHYYYCFCIVEYVKALLWYTQLPCQAVFMFSMCLSFLYKDRTNFSTQVMKYDWTYHNPQAGFARLFKPCGWQTNIAPVISTSLYSCFCSMSLSSVLAGLINLLLKNKSTTKSCDVTSKV